MNTTTNTAKTNKRPYRKTGKYSKKRLSIKGNPVKTHGGDIYRITETFNAYLNMTKRERSMFENFVKAIN